MLRISFLLFTLSLLSSCETTTSPSNLSESPRCFETDHACWTRHLKILDMKGNPISLLPVSNKVFNVSGGIGQNELAPKIVQISEGINVFSRQPTTLIFKLGNTQLFETVGLCFTLCSSQTCESVSELVCTGAIHTTGQNTFSVQIQQTALLKTSNSKQQKKLQSGPNDSIKFQSSATDSSFASQIEKQQNSSFTDVSSSVGGMISVPTIGNPQSTTQGIQSSPSENASTALIPAVPAATVGGIVSAPVPAVAPITSTPAVPVTTVGGGVPASAPSVSFSLGGTISGLSSSGLVLRNNGGDDLTVNSGASSFTFASALNSGSTYAVTVYAHPTGRTCTVANGSGAISVNVTNVSISCVSNTIGGTISGLSASGLVLRNNGGNDLTVDSGSSSFTFSTALNNGATYAVTIQTQPTGRYCFVSSGSGTATGAVSGISITCYPKKKTFITAGTFTGNLASQGSSANGIAGADYACGHDANNPSDGSTYKAFIVDAVNRIACTTSNCGGGVGEHTDWVLGASTTYVRSDGTTVIGTTNSTGLFTFPLTNSFVSSVTYFWTGFNANWLRNTMFGVCLNWTDSSGGMGGQHSSYGAGRTVVGMDLDFNPIYEDATSYLAVYAVDGANCSNTVNLLCVEQ